MRVRLPGHSLHHEVSGHQMRMGMLSTLAHSIVLSTNEDVKAMKRDTASSSATVSPSRSRARYPVCSTSCWQTTEPAPTLLQAGRQLVTVFLAGEHSEKSNPSTLRCVCFSASAKQPACRHVPLCGNVLNVPTNPPSGT